jgi:hypothetical protein
VHGGVRGAEAGGTLATDETLGSTAHVETPIPPRTVTIVPRDPSPVPAFDDRQDFHAALRNVLKPRK